MNQHTNRGTTLVLAVVCAAVAGWAASTVCDKLGEGYYCVDNMTYAHCDEDRYGARPALHKCRYPRVCKCGNVLDKVYKKQTKGAAPKAEEAPKKRTRKRTAKAEAAEEKKD